MKEMLISVCDTQEEAQFAFALWNDLEYTVAEPEQVQHVQLLEVDGPPPDFVLSGKFARAGQALWIVTARR